MTTQRPRDRARWRARTAKRLAKWLGLLAGLAIIATFVVLHNLDQPWVKHRVQAIVAKELGVAIDYGAVRLALSSGIDVDDLVVASPPEVRGVAPELARFGHVAARWSLGSVATPGERIARLTLSDGRVTIAVDENGRSSLDLLSPPSKKPTVPLSRRPESLLRSWPSVGHLEVDRVSVALVQTDHGSVIERTALRGVALELRVQPKRGGTARLRLGSESTPLELDLERRGNLGAEGTAHARAFAVAVATSSDLALTIEVQVVDQSLVAGFGLTPTLRAAGRAHFDVPAARTNVMIDAATADGSANAGPTFATIPDEGPPVLHCAVGDVDAASLLAWLPADLVPIRADRAHVRYRIVGATLAIPPRLDDGGAIEIHGDVAKLRLALGDGGSLGVDTGSLAVHVLPDAASSATVHGSATLAGVTLASAAGESTTGGAAIRIDGRGSPDGALDGTVDLRFASVQTSGSVAMAAHARDGHFVLRLGDVHLDLANPLASRGDLALTGEVAAISAHSASSSGLASTLGVRAHVPLSGHAPYAANAELSATRLQLSGRDKLADAPARIAIDVSNASPNLARLIASTGTAHAEVALGAVKIAVDARKQADAIDYELHANAPTLEPLRPLLPADTTALLPLHRMALELESKGRIERISSALPELRHHTKLDVDRPGFGPLSARSLAVSLESRGTAMRQDAELDLRARGLSIDGSSTADDHVTVSARIDRAQSALRLIVGSDGRTTGRLAVAVSFDRGRRALAYDVHGNASNLVSLAPLLAGRTGLEDIDLSALEVGVSAKGELFGVVTDVEPDGTPRFEPNPAVTAALTGPIDVRVDHFGFAQRQVAVTVPKLAWHGDFGIARGRRTLESRLDVGSVHLAVGSRVLDVAGISDHLSATVVGDLRNPDADVTEHVEIATGRQEFLRAYPVGEMSLDLSARRDRRGIVRLGGLRLANTAGGTMIRVTGNVDLSGVRRRLALQGEIEQDMARLTTDVGELAGRGRASAVIRVETGDLVTFRTRTDVRLDGVDLRLPSRGIVIESLDGTIPIKLDIRAAADGVSLVRSRQSSPYSLLRFVDQHPLLTRTSFLTARSITTPWVSIAPFTANLQIEHNIVALAQLEMGVRGGRVSGECVLDYAGEDSTLEVHVRASGVRSSYDEPFDGNAALFVSARDGSVDGRGDILRVGKRHFVDLLDLVDPTRTDASANGVRGVLWLGHPSRVSLVFKHGFANAHIEMGGLASLVSVGDIRGVPTGPLIQRMLRPRHGSKGRR